VALLEQIAGSGCTTVSVDWRQPLDVAWMRIGHEVGIQGNLDPALLLAPWPAVERGARDVLQRVGGRVGHIFNLGHGILPQTDPETLARVVRLVHGEG
jgi:uroporphyrinogen decarboxylase